MTIMFEYSTQLEEALRRRGDPISASDFLAVLTEASGESTEALSAGERSFLLEHTDLTDEDLSEKGRAASGLVAAGDRAAAEAAIVETSLSTGEVAQLMDRFPANVRRSRGKGDLYAPVGAYTNTRLRFPRWQFIGNQVLPGLREIIPAFPASYHPLAIERIMTTEDEALDGFSPVQWLARGGSVEAVLRLVDELNYE